MMESKMGRREGRLEGKTFSFPTLGYNVGEHRKGWSLYMSGRRPTWYLPERVLIKQIMLLGNKYLLLHYVTDSRLNAAKTKIQRKSTLSSGRPQGLLRENQNLRWRSLID